MDRELTPLEFEVGEMQKAFQKMQSSLLAIQDMAGEEHTPYGWLRSLMVIADGVKSVTKAANDCKKAWNEAARAYVDVNRDPAQPSFDDLAAEQGAEMDTDPVWQEHRVAEDLPALGPGESLLEAPAEAVGTIA